MEENHMTQLKNNVEISFNDGRAVVIEELDEQQQKQLSQILQNSGVWYRWTAWLVSEPGFWGRIDKMWDRLNRWLMAPLLLVAVLSGVAMAQQRPGVVTPVRVAIAFSEDCDFNDALRDELQRQRPVVFVSEGVNYDIYATSGPIGQGEKTIGYACAVAIVTGGKRDAPIRVYLVTGPTVEDTAKRAAKRINEHMKGGK
jgi:hypothetical protein